MSEIDFAKSGPGSTNEGKPPGSSMIGIVSDPVFMNHDTGSGHPETPQRIPCLHSLFSGEDPDILMVQPVAADEEDILLNHSRAYVDLVRRSCENGSGYLDPGTAYSRNLQGCVSTINSEL